MKIFPLLWVHNSLDLLLFGNLRKFSGNVRKCSSGLLTIFEESSEISGKCSEIFGKSSKTSSLVCLYNKQNITCPLVDTNFIFSCSTRNLTRSPRSLVRYRVEHSKKYVSTRRHVISSIFRTVAESNGVRTKIAHLQQVVRTCHSIFNNILLFIHGH